MLLGVFALERFVDIEDSFSSDYLRNTKYTFPINNNKLNCFVITLFMKQQQQRGGEQPGYQIGRDVEMFPSGKHRAGGQQGTVSAVLIKSQSQCQPVQLHERKIINNISTWTDVESSDCDLVAKKNTTSVAWQYLLTDTEIHSNH